MNRSNSKIKQQESSQLKGTQNHQSLQNNNKQASQISVTYVQDIERYTRPTLPQKQHLKYQSTQLNNLAPTSNLNIPSINDRTEYPTSGQHSRYPVVINCQKCNQLTITDIQYEHGKASWFWCLILLPFFCSGLCCLCLNSCKDVKHVCTKCHRDAGICKSQVI